MPEPTFVFDDDGTAYAYLDGKVVASATDADELEQKLAQLPPTAPQGAPGMGGPPPGPPGVDPQGADPQAVGAENDPLVQQAVQILEQKAPELLADGGPDGQEEPSAIGQADLPAASPDTLPEDSLPPRETHVETPNGLKGQILGKVKDLWGEEVTIRLENGRIAKFHVTEDTKFTNEKTASAPSPLAALEARLEATPDGTKESLSARITELKKIKAEASALIRTREVTANTAHELVVLADHELREVNDALAALEDAEPYAPPAPFDPQVAEQESVGGGDSTWLDDTFGQMVDESEATDFDQLMDEGPEVMVAGMETPALEDAEGVADQASQFVSSKVAGIERDAVEEFRAEFLRRIEAARKMELETREEKQTQQREAAVEDDGPDEGLFL